MQPRVDFEIRYQEQFVTRIALIYIVPFMAFYMLRLTRRLNRGVTLVNREVARQ